MHLDAADKFVLFLTAALKAKKQIEYNRIKRKPMKGKKKVK